MRRKPGEVVAKRKIAAGWVGTIIILAIFLTIFPITGSLAQPKTTIDPVIEAHILGTTLQIKLFAPKPGHQPATGARPYILAQGLGTLAIWHDEHVIVTHNHWGEMLTNAEFVQILDAQGQLELELSGADFRTLLRYQDAGTLIVTAPESLDPNHSANLAVIGDCRKVGAGEAVVFVHQALDGNSSVALLTAEIVDRLNTKAWQYSRYRPNGQPIISGNSGVGCGTTGYWSVICGAGSLRRRAKPVMQRSSPLNQRNCATFNDTSIQCQANKFIY